MSKIEDDGKKPEEVAVTLEGVISEMDVITAVPNQGVMVGMRLTDLPEYFEKAAIYEADVDVEFESQNLSFCSDVCIEGKRFDPSTKKMFRTVLTIIRDDVPERELAGAKMKITIHTPRKYTSEQFDRFRSAVSSRARGKYEQKKQNEN